MVLPLIGGVLAIGSLLGIVAIFTMIVDELALLTAAFVALMTYLTFQDVDFGAPEPGNMLVAVGLAGVTGWVVYNILGAILAAFGLLAGLGVMAVLFIGGTALVRAVVGGVVQAVLDL